MGGIKIPEGWSYKEWASQKGHLNFTLKESPSKKEERKRSRKSSKAVEKTCAKGSVKEHMMHLGNCK